MATGRLPGRTGRAPSDRAHRVACRHARVDPAEGHGVRLSSRPTAEDVAVAAAHCDGASSIRSIAIDGDASAPHARALVPDGLRRLHGRRRSSCSTRPRARRRRSPRGATRDRRSDPPGHRRRASSGGVPLVLATASADGIPNVTYLSKAHVVDEHRIALSNQFISKSARNLAENPQASHAADRCRDRRAVPAPPALRAHRAARAALRPAPGGGGRRRRHVRR